MRASTLFALTMAVLLGLGVAVAVKMSGYFAKPPEQPAVAKVDVPVLVAGRNLFAGDVIDPAAVGTRAMRPDELKDYEKNKDLYLPAVPAAAAMRVALKNIEADKPIRRDMLQELAKPETLSLRLLPGMRAVNVAANKDHSAGGLIAPGEWADVLLTTTVDDGTGGPPTTRTAAVAHKVRVITKRNGLWNVFAPLPDDKLVTFTLEANPYRAALIEYAKTRGTLSLTAVSSAEQKALEGQRQMALEKNIKPVSYAPFSMDDSTEYQDEDLRVDAMNKGQLSINTLDLVRIFNIRTPEPPTSATAVQQLSGVTRLKPAVFNRDGSPADGQYVEAPQGKGRANANGIRFLSPSECAGCKSRAIANALMGK
jgi:Flp pilus assembly protein CpaB